MIWERQLHYKTIAEETFKETYPEGPRQQMQKKKGQEFEVCEYIYLCGLVQHASFEKAMAR